MNIAAVATVAIAVGLWVTPMQTITVAGQSLRVGAAAPSLTLSGPGELDLFGQRLPTAVEFVGPVRPRIELTRITLSQQLDELVGGRAGAGSGQGSPAAALQDALVAGWLRYLGWQVAITGAVALLLLGAVAGWRRSSRRATVVLLAVGLMVTQAINLGAIMITTYTAPERLRQVRSLQALVGAAPAPALPLVPRSPLADGGRIAVIGDSTAAGLGNPPVPNANDYDAACQRSVDAFPAVLDRATNWQVRNLACSGATIRAGLLGPQRIGTLTVEPQLTAAVADGPSAIVINVGANDVNWSALLRVCAAAAGCQDAAQEAYFQQQLIDFARDYFVLLTRLRAVPELPVVVVNLYYDPFDGASDCLMSVGITPDKRRSLMARLETLNTILAEGAATAGFAVARPNFSGHGVCSRQPFVQAADAAAPLHPTTAGALAIAIADQQALRDAGIR